MSTGRKTPKKQLIYKEAIKWDENNTTAYYNLGTSYKEMEQYDEAIKYAVLCLEKSRDDSKGQSEVYKGLGDIYRDMGDYKKAKECFKKALQLDSENEDAKTALDELQ